MGLHLSRSLDRRYMRQSSPPPTTSTFGESCLTLGTETRTLGSERYRYYSDARSSPSEPRPCCSGGSFGPRLMWSIFRVSNRSIANIGSSGQTTNKRKIPGTDTWQHCEYRSAASLELVRGACALDYRPFRVPQQRRGVWCERPQIL